ncbi:hypothetical protein NYF23_01290 [SAR92 clade bacterium H455]|uniref:Uncharacterized protein n=1 Tax=SAR92 clade bacterium H455 TaxID=2974818 RepID=A0ABY5TNF1_9GAMM|nr:hypothetical protein NYF23_01290 [SAR92 clade bacterium H455]
MELDNSKNINNKIKKSTVSIAIIAHLILAILTFGVPVALSTVTALVTLRLLKEDIETANSKDDSFDKNSNFKLIAYSLFSIMFWIGLYLSHGRNLLSRVRPIYSSAYNDKDIETQVHCLHEVVFDGMIAELDKNGVDSGPLK